MDLGAYWMNYKTGKLYRVTEHYSSLMDMNFAKKIGLPNAVYEHILGIKDRDEGMLYVLANSPLVRIRGYGGAVSIQFNSTSYGTVLDAIRKFVEDSVGESTQLSITNFADNMRIGLSGADFQETVADGRNPLMVRSFKAKKNRVRLTARIQADNNVSIREGLNGG